jgi:hypothetical protein
MDEKKLRKYAGIEKLEEGKATPVLLSVGIKEIADELRRDKKLVQKIMGEIIHDTKTRKKAEGMMEILEQLSNSIEFVKKNTQ